MTMVSSVDQSSWTGVASAEVARPPDIDLAAKQMCMEAQRMVYQLMADGVRSDVAMPLLRYGHCWCSSVNVFQVETGVEIKHRFCCKCGDRYAVEQAQESKES